MHTLRVVPHPHRFPDAAWSDDHELSELFDWTAPAWCDPGDPDDWIARATTGQAHGADAADDAREHYDTRVRIREERIDLFTAMCRRAGVTAPSTLAQLLDCLLAFDLYQQEEIDGQRWLLPRLWRNPLEVLPLTFTEAAEEAGHQQHERAMLVGAGLRRCVLADDPRTAGVETVTVTTTLRAIGQHAKVHAGQVRPALEHLAANDMVTLDGADLDHVDLDTPIQMQLPWPQFEHVFDFDELPAPEHFH